MHAMATKQFLLRIDESLIEELEAAAVRYGVKSGNQVAADVLAFYLEFYREAKEAELEAREAQREALKKAPAATKVAPVRRKAS